MCRKCVFRLILWIADTPEKAKLMMTNGHTCNVCKAGKQQPVLWSNISGDADSRDVGAAIETWRHAGRAFVGCSSRSSGMKAANEIMKTELLKFCPVEPILYNLPDFDFKSLAYEEMHTLEGLSQWMVKFTISAIEDKHAQGALVCRSIDKLAAEATQDMTPLLRPLGQGFTSTTFATYQEWKTVIVILLPLVSMTCEGDWVEETLASFMMLRQIIRRQLHTSRTLAKLRTMIERTKHLIKQHFSEYSPSEMNFPKFHDLDHLCDSIKEYGCIFNASAQSEESAHIMNSKSTYRQTNRQKMVEKQMSEVIILYTNA